MTRMRMAWLYCILLGLVVACGSGADESSVDPGEVAQEAVTSPPTVTSFTPAKAVQGATVTINGTNFVPDTAVAFNGTPASSVTYSKASKVTAVVPPGATTGFITVTTPRGTATSSTVFGVLPSLTSVSPNAGIIGDQVTIAGSGLTGTTSVTFGSVAAAFAVVDDATITTAVPANAVTARITVTTPQGSKSTATTFTVVKLPKITSFTPTSSTLPTTLTISGSNFPGTTSVTVGGVAVDSFTITSASKITAAVAPGTPSGKLSVTNEAGTATSKTTFSVIDLCAGVVCATGDACHAAGVCDPSTGLCSDPAALPDGTGCSDGDACTQTDICVAGTCTGTNPVVCAATNSCHVAGTCDSTTGACSTPACHCEPGDTGPGIVNRTVIVDGTDTAGDLAAIQGAWCITGDLYVTGTTLTDLSALSSLGEVAGHVRLGYTLPGCTFPCTAGNANLTDLHGLEGLQTIGKDLYLWEGYSSTGVKSLGPLAGLRKVGGDIVMESTNALPNLRGLEGIDTAQRVIMSSTRGLVSLAGLEHLRNVQTISLWDTPDLVDITALRGVTSTPQSFQIDGATSLTNLAGIENLVSVGDFMIANVSYLADLSPLSSLRTVTGSLTLSSAPLVTSVLPFSGITRLQSLDIDNAGVTSLHGFENLTSVQFLYIEHNPALADLMGLEALHTLTYLYITRNASLANLDGLGGLSQITGRFEVTNNASLPECSVEKLETQVNRFADDASNNAGTGECGDDGSGGTGECWVGTLSLRTAADIARLAGRTCITGNLAIDAAAELTDLQGLEGITRVSGDLRIQGTPLQSVTGLGGLVEVAGTLSIDSNVALTSLAGLSSLQHAGKLFVRYNDALTDMPLPALTGTGGWFVSSNPLLPACQILMLEDRVHMGCVNCAYYNDVSGTCPGAPLDGWVDKVTGWDGSPSSFGFQVLMANGAGITGTYSSAEDAHAANPELNLGDADEYDGDIVRLEDGRYSVNNYAGFGACCASTAAEAASWYPWMNLRMP